MTNQERLRVILPELFQFPCERLNAAFLALHDCVQSACLPNQALYLEFWTNKFIPLRAQLLDTIQECLRESLKEIEEVPNEQN